MPILTEARQDVVDALNAAGITAHHTQDRLAPPCALVSPTDTGNYLQSAASFTRSQVGLVIDLYAGSANPDTGYEELDQMIEDTIGALRNNLDPKALIDYTVSSGFGFVNIGTATYLSTDIEVTVWVEI